MPETVENARREILKRVGVPLIAFGLFDIGVMIYCLINHINYSSSFNIFAVLAGIFVWRGHPWWVQWASRASGFFLGAFIAAIIASPFLFPIDLGVREMQAHPLGAAGLAIYSLGAMTLLAWTHWQLRSPAVVPSEPSVWVSWRPSALGAALAICIFTLVSVTLHGESSHTAIEWRATRSVRAIIFGYRISEPPVSMATRVSWPTTNRLSKPSMWIGDRGRWSA